MHAQYFALLNLILKLQFCGEASLEFPFFNFPAIYYVHIMYRTYSQSEAYACFDVFTVLYKLKL